MISILWCYHLFGIIIKCEGAHGIPHTTETRIIFKKLKRSLQHITKRTPVFQEPWNPIQATRHRVSSQVEQRAESALGWTSDISANHPLAWLGFAEEPLSGAFGRKKSGYLMHRDTKKRAESTRGCGLALFKNRGNTCYHIYSIRHCACNVHIFVWIFFLWCFFTRKRE